MQLDEFQITWRRLERRLRDPRVVEVLARTDLAIDTKADFSEETNLRPVYEALKALKIETELKREEEHSAWMVTFKDPTNAERAINLELAAQPEYKTPARHGAADGEVQSAAVRGGERQRIARPCELARSAGPREERRHARSQRPALQGSGRDERRAALGNHHEHRDPHAAQESRWRTWCRATRSSPR